MGFESFSSAREKLSLKDIKEQIKKDTQNKIDKLKIEMGLINTLHSHKGLIIKKGDELDYIKALTSEGNKLEWTDQKEADLIHPGDIIKIELEGTNRIITKNGKNIGNIISGFEKKKEDSVVAKVPKKEKLTPTIKPKGPKKPSNGEQEQTPHTLPATGEAEKQIPTNLSSPSNSPQIKENHKTNKPKYLPEEIVLQYIDNSFNKFKEAINKLDTTLDVQSSSEKKGNKEYLDVMYNNLITELNNQKENSSKEIQNKINEIKLYLATYYADEGEVENSNFSNYTLSNELALQVLGDIKGKIPPQAPNMQDNILGSFKGTGIGTYITTQLKNGESVTDIFENNIVKNATKEESEKLKSKYEDDLDNYLNNAEENEDSLTEVQKQALNLLKDVNGTGFFNIKNSTTDMFDIMGWDFAAIGTGIGTGAGVGTLVGGPVGFVGGAIAGGATATIGMMLNHGDNYFSKDWQTGLTEFGINTATFGVGGLAFKGARLIQGSSTILSAKGIGALSLEASSNLVIGATADITRGWAYNMNIEIGDAIVNNLVWALLPIAFKGKQIFSLARKRLASETAEVQQKASILSKLGDKTGAKKLIDKLSDKIKSFRNKEEVYIYRGKEYVKNPDGSFTNTATGKPYKGKIENLKKQKKNVEGEKSIKSAEKLKITEALGKVGKYLFDKINKGLSKSGKEKMKANGGEEGFIKDFKENLWKKIESDYEGWRIITGTLKSPFRAGVFGIQQVGKHVLKPTWEVASAINPVKMHKNLNWKQKLIGGLVTSTIYEGMTTMNTDESILDRKHLANIPINGIQLATVGIWTFLSEPLVNTLYGKYKGFEQRDFIPSYFDNMFGNITQREMPYELGEALILDEKEILEKTIKAYEKANYNESTIKPLRDKLLSLK